jgi:prepilin-type N-terminal cleavage/methylation domain-containing protein/prepilin-type processing-associated H-X9-DG protein
MNNSTNRAFTLIELLVTIALIGVLGGLAFAGVGNMVDRGNATKCLASMRQVGSAAHLFSADNDLRLPGTSHGTSWTVSLAGYLGPKFIGRCPSCPNHPARITYGWNDSLADAQGNGIRAASCRIPGQTMVLAELAIDQTSEHFHFAGGRGGAARVTPDRFKAAVNVKAHGNGANYLFVDGHAENLPWTEVQRRLQQPGTTFLVP